MSRWPNIPLHRRIEERVQIVSESGCWIWMGRINPRTGYGVITFEGVPQGAHRASLRAFRNIDVKGVTVCHTCDVPFCVNPAHLYAGTPADNARDRILRGRANTAFGERAGAAKLTQEQVVEILTSAERGKDIAARIGISASVVSQIRSRQIWRSVTTLPADRIEAAAQRKASAKR